MKVMSRKTKGTVPKEEAVRTLVPKLRFPDFRGAAGWTERPLKSVAHINPANSELPESFVYIDLESVDAGELKAKRGMRNAEIFNPSCQPLRSSTCKT